MIIMDWNIWIFQYIYKFVHINLICGIFFVSIRHKMWNIQRLWSWLMSSYCCIEKLYSRNVSFYLRNEWYSHHHCCMLQNWCPTLLKLKKSYTWKHAHDIQENSPMTHKNLNSTTHKTQTCFSYVLWNLKTWKMKL